MDIKLFHFLAIVNRAAVNVVFLLAWALSGSAFSYKEAPLPRGKAKWKLRTGSKRSKMNFLFFFLNEFSKGKQLREGPMSLGLWRGSQSSQTHFSREPHPQTQEGRLHLPGAWQRCSQRSTPPTVHPRGPPLLSPFLPKIPLPIRPELGTHAVFPLHSPSCLHGMHSLCSSKVQVVGLKVTHTWCVPGLVLLLQDTWQWLETLLVVTTGGHY